MTAALTPRQGPVPQARPTPASIAGRRPAVVRLRGAAEVIRNSGGVLVLVGRLATAEGAAQVEFAEVDSEGATRLVAIPARAATHPEGGVWAAYVAGSGARLATLYPRRLVALYSELTSWGAQALGELSDAPPHLHLPLGLAPAELSALLQQVWEERAAALAQQDATPRHVGADGSRRAGRNTSTWAWIDHRGRYAAGCIETRCIHVAELTAVLQAVRSAPESAPLRVRSDSRHAVGAVAQLRRGDFSLTWWLGRAGASQGRLSRLCQWAATELPLRDVEVTWVRGHAGDPLNEAAHRLAVASRRALEADVGPAVRHRICEGIAADLRQQLRGVAL